MSEHRLRRRAPTRVRLLAGAAAVVLLAVGPGMDSFNDRALAQGASVSITTEFHRALDSYGEWRVHPRWGEVWIPTHVAADWRPYEIGHWSYTNEWGWFWISAEEFGWITYHYGRWVDDRDFGWIWIPRREWSPAWVSWRRGHGHIGWAPLPPDEILVVEESEEPAVWTFVREVDFLAPRIETVVLAERETTAVFRETVVENRTILVEQNRIAVNPGIPPAF